MSEDRKTKVIKGIGVLTMLSDKDNEMLKKTDVIKGIGIVVIRENFYSKYPNISLEGIGNIISVPDDANVSLGMGVTTVNQEYLEAISDTVHIVSMGAVIVAPDADPKMLVQKISGIQSMGAVVCSETLLGTVSSILNSQMSVVVTYPDNSSASAKFNNGNISLTEEYVESLSENTVLLINGNFYAIDPINETLIKDKVLHVIVNGTYTVSRANQKFLSAKSTINGTTVVVPSGYEYMNGNLELNINNIERYKGKKIFIKETAVFGKELTSEIIERNPFSLICDTAVFHKSIDEAVNSILEGLETNIISYNGDIVINHGCRKITPKELQYAKSPIYLLNYGDAEFDEAIADDIFYEKISEIHNFGSLKCSEELYGLVQSKMAENEGSLITFEESSEKKEKNEKVLLSGLGKVEL